MNLFGTFFYHISALLSLDWIHRCYTKWASQSHPEPDLVGYHLTNLSCMVYFSVVGTATWISKGVRSSWIHYALIWPMYHYQSWNLVTSLQHDSLSDIASLFHHTATMLLSLLAISYPVLEYPAIYMIGPFEVSSIFLTLHNLFDINPQWKERYRWIHTGNKLLFATCFLGIRIVGMIYYLGRYFLTLQPLLMSIIAPFLCLQFFWAYQIIRILIHTLPSVTNS